MSESVQDIGRTIAGPQGIPLYVESYGDVSTSPTIVFVHGGWQALQCWRFQYPVLSQRYHVVGMDLPWHGQSNPISEEIQSTQELWADSIHAVLTSLNLLDRPVVIAFWSFGGIVMRHYLYRYGHAHIRGLISVASFLSGYPYYVQIAPSILNAPTSTAVTDLRAPAADLFASLHQFVGALTKERPPLSEYYYTYGYNARAFETTTRSMTALLAIEDTIDTEVFLRGLDLPVLLIQGKDDVLVLPPLARKMAELLPDATLLEYENAGHSTFLEQPLRFNQDVQTFVDSLSERSK
jgi:non-heme chloroperoxidase